MKKLVILVLAIMLIATLVACGTPETKEEKELEVIFNQIKDEFEEWEDNQQKDRAEAEAGRIVIEGVWELISAANTNFTILYIFAVSDSETFFIQEINNEQDLIWSNRSATDLNNNVSLRSFVMPIEKYEGDTLILSDGTARKEYKRVTSNNPLKESDLIGLWIATSYNDEKFKDMFICLMENGTANYFRDPPFSSGNMWQRDFTSGYYDAKFFILENYLFLQAVNSPSSNPIMFEIESISNDSIIAKNLNDTVVFTNKNLNEDKFLGEWVFTGSSNFVPNNSSSMPDTIQLNNDGSGIWKEGNSTKNICWINTEEHLIKFTNDTVYFSIISEVSNNALVIETLDMFRDSHYYTFSK